MLDARNIASIMWSNITSRDVMRTVADFWRGIKLDNAAKQHLNISKYDDPAVSYENLHMMWLRGDRDKLVAYCLLDTLLTALLDRRVKNGIGACALADIVKLSPRELFGH
jgi:hypothetical protein